MGAVLKGLQAALLATAIGTGAANAQYPQQVVDKYRDAQRDAAVSEAASSAQPTHRRAIAISGPASTEPADDYPYNYDPYAPQYLGINNDANICPAEHCTADPQSYKAAKRAGISTVRYTLYWSNVQPDPVKEPDWAQVERELAAMHDAGMHIYVNIAWAPAWATGGKPSMHPFECVVPYIDDRGAINVRFDPTKEYCAQPAPLDLDALERFTTKAVIRLGHLVNQWGILNEPEYDIFWPYGTRHPDGGFTPDYDALMRVYARFYDTVHWLYRDGARVHGPETGDPRMLDEILTREQRIGRVFDVDNVHTYGDPREFPQGALRDLDAIIDVRKRHNDTRTLWISEGGTGSRIGEPGSLKAQAERDLGLIAGARERGIPMVMLYRLQGNIDFWDLALIVKDRDELLAKPALIDIEHYAKGTENGNPVAPDAARSYDPKDELYSFRQHAYVRKCKTHNAWEPIGSHD